MTGGSFGCRREDGLGQLIGFPQERRKGDPADLAGALVFLPARTRQIATHHALHREHLSADHHHGAAAELSGMPLHRSRVTGDIGGDYVVGNNILQEIEPEQRDLGEDFPLVGNSGS